MIDKKEAYVILTFVFVVLLIVISYVSFDITGNVLFWSSAESEGDGDLLWQDYREDSARSLHFWPDSMPSLTADTRLTVSSDSNYILLSNSRYVAMFISPGAPDYIDGTGLVAFGDRDTGMDFVRARKDVYARSWAICVGDDNIDGITCPTTDTGYSWIFGEFENAECFLEDLEGNVISSTCEEGNAPVLVFRWSDVTHPDVGSITVEQRWMLDSDGLSHMPKMEGGSGSDKGAVVFRSPVITGLGLDPDNGSLEEIDIVIPYSHGVLWENGDSPLVGTSVFQYPSNSLGMQFMGYIQGDNGLYVGAEDPEYAPKVLKIIRPRIDSFNDNKDSFYVGHFVLNPGGPLAQDIDNLWWINLKHVDSGDGWISIAREYRDWTLDARPRTLLLDRDDLPQGLRDSVYWRTSWPVGNGDVNSYMSIINATKRELPGVKFGFHLYDWYFPGFNLGNGNLPDGGFTMRNLTYGDIPKMVKDLESEGHYVNPYINPNSADITDFYHDYGNGTIFRFDRPGYVHGNYSEFKDDLCIVPRGDSMTYPFNTGFHFGSNWLVYTKMQSDSSFWKNRVSLMWNSARQLNSSGVYFDTYGDLRDPCWNSSDPPYGYGSYAIEEQKSMVTDLVPGGNDGIFTSGEFITDSNLMDPIDLYYHYSFYDPEYIPLFQAVYGDSIINVGPAVSGFDSDLVYYYKSSMAFLSGNQLGLANYRGVYPEWPRLNFSKDLIQARLDLKDFLSYGVYMGEMQQTDSSSFITMGNSPYPTCSGDCWCREVTCVNKLQVTKLGVIGAYWSSYYGDDVLIYINPNNDSDHEVYVEIPSRFVGYDLLDCNYDSSDCRDASGYLTGPEQMLLNAGPHEIRVIYFSEPEDLNDGSGDSTEPSSSSSGSSDDESSGGSFVSSGTGIRIDLDIDSYSSRVASISDSLYLELSNKVYPISFSGDPLTGISLGFASGESILLSEGINSSYDVDLIPGDDIIFSYNPMGGDSFEIEVWRIGPAPVFREYPSAINEIGESFSEVSGDNPYGVWIFLGLLIFVSGVFGIVLYYIMKRRKTSEIIVGSEEVVSV